MNELEQITWQPQPGDALLIIDVQNVFYPVANWSVHCVAGTYGAKFPSALELADSTIIISKTTMPEEDVHAGLMWCCTGIQIFFSHHGQNQ